LVFSYSLHMARRRFFVDQIRDGRAEITGENAHHLTRVLRVATGQKYEITDSERAWLATIQSVHKNLVEFAIEEEIAPTPQPTPVTLYLSLIKFDRFEWAVEKATELGVARIVPVEASRSERGLFQGAGKRVERWRRIVREASEQSRRLRVPQVDDPFHFSAVFSDMSTHRLWLDEQPGAPMLARAFELGYGDAVALAVGPEGGWTSEERNAFVAAGWAGVSLGASILRTETAVCAALAVISQAVRISDRLS
jgi:16S rRNA (uracil1498-N3)-methyltransferase